MQFLPDVTVPCEVCRGSRYNREALEILYSGKNIAEVLAMTVDEAVEFFDAFPKARTKLKTLQDVGLGYMTLGQPATTVSRRRSAAHQALDRAIAPRHRHARCTSSTSRRRASSFEDVRNLLTVLQRLASAGNTVVVIEHHIDVMLNADHIIDLGPLGGYRGGMIVAEGTPEEVARHETSATARFLREAMERRGLVIENGPSRNGKTKRAPKAKKAPKAAEAAV